MKKSFVVTAVITALIYMSFAFTGAYAPLYKNLKVLPKNIAKPQMDSVMRSFTRALGVKCNYCHAKNDQGEGLNFASDQEETKLTARQMMRMQFKINKKFFHIKNVKDLDTKLEVTCYACHHGQGIPARFPAAQTPPPPPPAQPRQM